ncbi:hypothetical protein IMSHALPRED_006060 [Imshaugia aleurites]|uniref:Uncharacterized protein n=1 Tax=Imshaugia aleurites TaxID=172621 RepID=A0A8H3FG96_9LECA|nr:hypothetical protein IMSHALPRED_006060 [Imshaugia aleurites]
MCAIARTYGFKDATASAGHSNPVESVLWAVLEINVGIIAASIATLKPLFNPLRPSLLRYFRYRKAVDSPQCDDADDNPRLQKLTLGTMPSALPSSLSYYQHKGENHMRVEEF